MQLLAVARKTGLVRYSLGLWIYGYMFGFQFCSYWRDSSLFVFLMYTTYWGPSATKGDLQCTISNTNGGGPRPEDDAVVGLHLFARQKLELTSRYRKIVAFWVLTSDSMIGAYIFGYQQLLSSYANTNTDISLIVVHCKVLYFAYLHNKRKCKHEVHWSY